MEVTQIFSLKKKKSSFRYIVYSTALQQVRRGRKIYFLYYVKLLISLTGQENKCSPSC